MTENNVTPKGGLAEGEEYRPENLSDSEEELLDANGGIWKIQKTDGIYHVYTYYPIGHYEHIARGETKVSALKAAISQVHGVIFHPDYE